MMTRAAIALGMAAMTVSLSAPTTSHARTALPPVDRVTLDNGLTVLLMENHLNPFVEVRFVVRAGSGCDPAGKEGLASLTATMLTNGTPTRTEDEIAATIDDMGARLGASASRDTLELGGSVVTLDRTHLATFLDVFADVLRNASFPTDSLEKTRTLRLAAIERMADSHAGLASAAFAAWLYGDGPRGRLVNGTLTSVKGLAREDLVAYHRAVLVPQHAILAIAGDFQRDAMLAWIQGALGDPAWGQGACQGAVEGRCAKLCAGEICFDNPFALADRQDEVARERRVLLVDRDDPSINQIQWRLGTDNAVRLQDPEWPAFRLGTQILGGDFTARLNTTLRVKEGLTYGARFHVDYGARDSGAMQVSTYVAPKDLGKAIDLAIAELEGVRAAPMPEVEVESFRAKIINGFPFKFETVSDTLAQYLYLAAEGVPVSWLETYTDQLAVPQPDAVHAALSTIDPAQMVLVAVGNRDLVPILAAHGPVTVVTATDFLSSGLAKAAPAEAAAAAGGAE